MVSQSSDDDNVVLQHVILEDTRPLAVGSETSTKHNEEDASLVRRGKGRPKSSVIAVKPTGGVPGRPRGTEVALIGPVRSRGRPNLGKKPVNGPSRPVGRPKLQKAVADNRGRRRGRPSKKELALNISGCGSDGSLGLVSRPDDLAKNGTVIPGEGSHVPAHGSTGAFTSVVPGFSEGGIGAERRGRFAGRGSCVGGVASLDNITVGLGLSETECSHRGRGCGGERGRRSGGRGTRGRGRGCHGGGGGISTDDSENGVTGLPAEDVIRESPLNQSQCTERGRGGRGSDRGSRRGGRGTRGRGRACDGGEAGTTVNDGQQGVTGLPDDVTDELHLNESQCSERGRGGRGGDRGIRRGGRGTRGRGRGSLGGIAASSAVGSVEVVTGVTDGVTDVARLNDSQCSQRGRGGRGGDRGSRRGVRGTRGGGRGCRGGVTASCDVGSVDGVTGDTDASVCGGSENVPAGNGNDNNSGSPSGVGRAGGSLGGRNCGGNSSRGRGRGQSGSGDVVRGGRRPRGRGVRGGTALRGDGVRGGTVPRGRGARGGVASRGDGGRGGTGSRGRGVRGGRGSRGSGRGPRRAAVANENFAPGTFGSFLKSAKQARRHAVTAEGYYSCHEDINNIEENSVGGLSQDCQWCEALYFRKEKPQSGPYLKCCNKGKVMVPPGRPYPPELKQLYLGKDDLSKAFMKDPRPYNNGSAMAAFAHNTIRPPGNGPIPYCVHGRSYHSIACLNPGPGQPRRYNQLYSVDTGVATQQRVDYAYQDCDPRVFEIIDRVIRRENPFYDAIKNMREVHEEFERNRESSSGGETSGSNGNFSLFFGNSTKRNIQQSGARITRDEISILMTGDTDQGKPERYVAMYWKDRPMEFFHFANPCVDPMIYPLPFVFGQLGYSISLFSYDENTSAPAELRPAASTVYEAATALQRKRSAVQENAIREIEEAEDAAGVTVARDDGGEQLNGAVGLVETDGTNVNESEPQPSTSRGCVIRPFGADEEFRFEVGVPQASTRMNTSSNDGRNVDISRPQDAVNSCNDAEGGENIMDVSFGSWSSLSGGNVCTEDGSSVTGVTPKRRRLCNSGSRDTAMCRLVDDVSVSVDSMDFDCGVQMSDIDVERQSFTVTYSPVTVGNIDGIAAGLEMGANDEYFDSMARDWEMGEVATESRDVEQESVLQGSPLVYDAGNASVRGKRRYSAFVDDLSADCNMRDEGGLGERETVLDGDHLPEMEGASTENGGVANQDDPCVGVRDDNEDENIEHSDIELDEDEEIIINNRNKEEKVTQMKFYSHMLHVRKDNDDKKFAPLFHSKKLFQQYICDAFVKMIDERLLFIRRKQGTLRAASYTQVAEQLENRAAAKNCPVGKMIILPSTFQNSVRNMKQHYRDAMYLVTKFGKPDYFITFTCNPKWVEITSNLFPGQTSFDRPDLVARVFNLKLREFVKELKSGKVFGPLIAFTYAVEYQKRGLPHVHLLVIVDRESKPNTAEKIDAVVSAEIPCPVLHPKLHERVTTHMLHGPCGSVNVHSPCMVDKSCIKKFPKSYHAETTVDDKTFPKYRRTDNSAHPTLIKRNEVTNRWVVPYNPYLLMKFNAHINIEVCSSLNSVKYIYKYVHKGHDRATVVVTETGMYVDPKAAPGSSENPVPDGNLPGPSSNANNMSTNRVDGGHDGNVAGPSGNGKNAAIDHDEVQEHIDGRYVCAPEAMGRLLGYASTHSSHAVYRLPVHLPMEQFLLYEEGLEREAIEKELSRRTPLLGWFELNKIDPTARGLRYTQVAEKYRWNKKNSANPRNSFKWTLRSRGNRTVARMHGVGTENMELFSLRLLLLHVTGCKSYEDIKEYPPGNHNRTFRDAAVRRGLLTDDACWDETMEEAIAFEMPKQLRQLYVALVVHGEVTDPLRLWNKYQQWLCEDHGWFNNPENAKNMALKDMQDLFRMNGKQMTNYNLPEPGEIDDEFYVESIRDADDELAEATRRSGLLNVGQRDVVEQILMALKSTTRSFDYPHGFEYLNEAIIPVDANGITPKLFYIDGPGGTGKTFVYNTIMAIVRSNMYGAIAVAPTGIAACLLPGGWTAHSRFGIPIPLEENSTSKIDISTARAAQLRFAKVIVWDEISMTHKYALALVDRLLQDIMRNKQPFGGKIVIVGGDFRQQLPIVSGGGRADAVNACVASSNLWGLFKKVALTENMRTDKGQREFADWLITLGDGDLPADNPDFPNDVVIPDEFILKKTETCNSMVDYIFGTTLQPDDAATYVHKAILCPLNEDTFRVNQEVIDRLEGEAVTFLSHDEAKPLSGDPHDPCDIATELLNKQTPTGLPPHILQLKVGAIIMLLRNLNPKVGLVNGARMVVTDVRPGAKVIRAKLMTGNFINEPVLIPRIKLCPTDQTCNLPVKLERTQFPIRLAFAMTISKSQGQTLQSVGIVLSKPVFGHGQLYTAFSRVVSKSNLKVQIGPELVENPSNVTSNIVYKEIFRLRDL